MIIISLYNSATWTGGMEGFFKALRFSRSMIFDN